MATFLRVLPVLLLALAAMPTTQAADPPKAMPVATPAFLDVVTFEFRADDETHKVVVTTAPTLLRVDEATDGYSILYNPATQFYTGLEHRNYTYWEFSWPEVRGAVESSKRYEKRLSDLGIEGLNPDNAASSTNAATASTPDASLGGGDTSGYVWRPTETKKRIADLNCVRWTGESLSGENCEVWCYAGLVPKVSVAIAQLRTVNEPMALVPVRTVVPDFIFPVYDALLKAGVTPVMINWGSGADKSTFRLVDQKTRDGNAPLFTVPKLYVKTTLITMDGMTDAQPAPDIRGTTNAPRVDHMTTPPNPFRNQ